MTDYEMLSKKIFTEVEVSEKEVPVEDSCMPLINEEDALSKVSTEGITDMLVKATLESFLKLDKKAQKLVVQLALDTYNKTRKWATDIETQTGVFKVNPEAEIDEILDDVVSKCNDNAIKALVYMTHKYFGKQLPKSSGKCIGDLSVAFRKDIVIVPIENPNSHSYELNRPIKFSSGDNKFIKFSSKKVEGNHMSCSRNSFRFPTFSEVVAYEYSIIQAFKV